MKLTVVGVPLSQGSKSARVFNGRAILTEGFGDKPRKLREWRQAIAEAARLNWNHVAYEKPLDCAVVLKLTFFVPRPPSAKNRLFPHTKPDLSKYVRAVEDALSKLAYTDDARIVKLDVLKRFADGQPPGVAIELREATEADL